LPEEIELWLSKKQEMETAPLFVLEDPRVPTKTALLKWRELHLAKK
jgi:hypothetical protein